MSLRDLDHRNLMRYQQSWCHAGYLIFSMELADSNLDELFQQFKGQFRRCVLAATEPRCMGSPEFLEICRSLTFPDLSKRGRNLQDLVPTRQRLVGCTRIDLFVEHGIAHLVGGFASYPLS